MHPQSPSGSLSRLGPGADSSKLERRQFLTVAIATQLEILDLRHFSARQLRPLLEQEALLWQRRLNWDYGSSTELLLEYLDSRVLPGFVALDRGKICGLTFCVYEAQKSVVGDVFSVTDQGEPSIAITGVLLQHLLDLLRASPTVNRIESQLLLYDSGSLDLFFLPEGFERHPRLFMECDLAAGGMADRRQRSAFKGADGRPLTLAPWSNEHYQPIAELIHEAYAGHVDSTINDQYRTLHGSLRFLHNIVRFPGCGVFEAGHSWVLTEGTGGAPVAVVLCSRVAANVAHVTQLCVAPRERGLGLGRGLLQHCMAELQGAGFEAISLTVTEQNEAAARLYRQLRFAVRHRFDAMVLNEAAMTRRPRPPIR